MGDLAGQAMGWHDSWVYKTKTDLRTDDDQDLQHMQLLPKV